MEQNIGEIISKSRRDRQMTQEEFAMRLGVTPQAVSKWERDMGLPDVSMLAGICNVLELDANILLGIKAEGEKAKVGGVDWASCTNLVAEPLELVFGKELVPVVMEGLKTDLIMKKRQELGMRQGMLLPSIRIRDELELAGAEFAVLSYGKELYRTTLDSLTEKTYEEMIDCVVRVCSDHYGDILNKSMVKSLVDIVKERYPGVADGLVPEQIGYGELLGLLKRKLKAGESIRDLIHILEELETSYVDRKSNLC